MDTRLYPISPEFFNKHIAPLITRQYSRAGRPARVSHYQVFNAILGLFKTGGMRRGRTIALRKYIL